MFSVFASAGFGLLLGCATECCVPIAGRADVFSESCSEVFVDVGAFEARLCDPLFLSQGLSLSCSPCAPVIVADGAVLSDACFVSDGADTSPIESVPCDPLFLSQGLAGRPVWPLQSVAVAPGSASVSGVQLNDAVYSQVYGEITLDACCAHVIPVWRSGHAGQGFAEPARCIVAADPVRMPEGMAGEVDAFVQTERVFVGFVACVSGSSGVLAAANAVEVARVDLRSGVDVGASVFSVESLPLVDVVISDHGGRSYQQSTRLPVDCWVAVSGLNSIDSVTADDGVDVGWSGDRVLLRSYVPGKSFSVSVMVAGRSRGFRVYFT